VCWCRSSPACVAVLSLCVFLGLNQPVRLVPVC
jgi:hypothetical protein